MKGKEIYVHLAESLSKSVRMSNVIGLSSKIKISSNKV